MGEQLRKLWNLICTVETIQSIIQWIGISKIISAGGTFAVMIWSVFEHRPTPEIVVISIATFALLLWINMGIVKLWDKRKKKSVDTSAQRNWLEQELASDLQRIYTGMWGRFSQWNFSNIYNREPYFTIFNELTNTTLFTFCLKGVSGFMKIEGQQCVNPPQVSMRHGITRDEPATVQLTQSISIETAKLIQDYGNISKEVNFDLRNVVWEIENTTNGYEQHKPRLTGGEHKIVPTVGLKIESKIDIVVRKHSVRKIEKQGYFPIDVEFTLKVPSLPIQLATAQLCIADEVIEPISVSPTIPRELKTKVELYMVKYEPTYKQVLKGRTTKLTREEELKFLVGQERWKNNKYMAHLSLELTGEKVESVESGEFQLDFSSFTVSSS